MNKFFVLDEGQELRYRVDIDGLRGAANTPSAAVCAALSAGGKIHAGERDGHAAAAYLIWNYEPTPSWLELIRVLTHNRFPSMDDVHDK